MNNKFMFGKLYSDLNENLYSELMETRTRFEITFNEYLNYVYDNNDSKLIQWNLYCGNVLSFEKIFDKYVYEFNVREMEELLKSIPSDSINILSSVYGMVNQYLNYHLAVKQTITINVLESFDRDEVLKVNRKAIMKKVTGLDEFWNKINEMRSKTDINNLVPFVFSRYGIVGSDMEYILSAKLDNIDNESMTYHTVDSDGNVIIVPIDGRFVNFCERVAYDNNEKFKGIGDIIKTDTELQVTNYILYNRQRKAEEESGIKMVQKDLYLSRILDFILEIRRERKVTTMDFQRIILMFYPNSSAGRYHSVKKFYENLVGEKVMSARTSESDLRDENSQRFVEKVKEELNFY